MPLILEQLQFSVDSSQLDEARIKIAKLGDAVNALNRPMQEMQRSSAKTAEAIAKSELAAEKARVAKEKLADSASTVTAKVDPLTKLMEKLSNTYTDMAAGMTRGESSILNQARSYGAMGDQLKAVADILQNIKTLNKDPFDASLGGVRSITQEFERLQQRADLAAQGILMTTKQLGEYSKLAAEARGRVVGLGMDPDSLEGQKAYNQLLSQSQKEYLDVLSVVKQLTDAEQQRLAVAKEQERLQKAAASASAARMQEWAKGVGGKSPELSSMAAFYKEQEVAARKLTAAEDDLILREQKLAFVNKELAAGLTTASANALFKYQKDLEAVGETADNVAKRTTAFRAALVEKQGFSPIKRIADDAAEARKQVDHLARALGPQITDIFVGLATGQSPMMVLLQQGGQLRDQLALAGVESNKMGEALKTSAAYMVTSVQGVAVAIGQLFGSAIAGAGKKVVELATAMTFTTGLFNEFKLAAAIGADAGDKFYLAMYRILQIAPVVIGLMSSYAAIMAGALLVAYFKVSKEVDNLTKSLILNGGSLALTKDSAIALARSLEETGVSVSQVVEVMTAMAKEGGFIKSEIETVTKAAIDMQKYGGVAVEDTVKSFAKMKDEPVKALLELAKNTGLVTDETVKMVIQLEEQGKKSEAAALAVKALADVNAEQVSRMKQDYSDLGIMLINVKTWFDDLWNGIKGVVYEPTAIEKARKALQDVGNQIVETEENLKASRGLGITTSDSRLNQLREQFKLRQQEYEQLIKSRDAEEAARKANSEASKIRADNAKLAEQYNTQIEKSGKLIKQYTGEIDANIEKINKGDANSALLSERNVILRKAIKEEEKKIADARKKDNAEGLSAAKKQENYYKKVLDAANNYYEKMIGNTEDLTQAEIRLQQLENDPEWKNLSKERQQKLKDIWLQNAALERQYKLTQEQRKIDIATGEARNKLISDGIKEVETIQQRVKDQEIALGLLEYENTLIGTTQTQREYLVALKKEELEYEKRLAEIKAKGFMEDQETKSIAALDREFELRKKILSASTYQKEFKEMQDVLSGAIADALFEGGKKGADSLKNYLKTAFRKYVIDVIINPIVGSLMGASGVQGASSSLLGNMGSSLLSNAVTGISGVASAFGTAFSNAALSTVQGWVGMSGTAAQMGTSLANAGAWAGSAAGTTASSIGASIGAYAPYALAAVVALDQLGYLDAWSGDPDAFLVQQAKGANQAYRTSTTSRFGTVGFVNGSASIMKNGKLVNEYGETQDVSTKAQNAALEVIRNLDNAIADTLNESQIQEISANLAGWYKKSWSFEGKMLEDWIASRYESILRSLDGSFGNMKDYQKEGEKLSETAVRLITTFTSVRNIFDTIGASAENLSYKLANEFAGAFGGADKFSTAFNSFYENFYSDAEKTANLTRLLTESFDTLGYSLPSTKEAFKELVLTAVDAGNPQLAASLLGLQDAFVALKDAADSSEFSVENLTSRLSDLRSNTDNAFDALKRAVEKEKSVLETRKQSIEENVNLLKEIFDLLDSSIKELYGNVSSTSQMQVQVAKQLINQAVVSRALPDSKVLGEAISTITASQASSGYATKVDLDRDRLRLANQLTALKDIAEPQLDTAEQQLKVLEEQLSYYDKMLEKYQEQIDALRGNSTLSVTEAIANLEAALVAEFKNLSALLVAIIRDLQAGIITSAKAIEEIQKSTGVELTPGQWTTAGGEQYWASTTGKALGYKQGGVDVITGATGSTYSVMEAANWINSNIAAGNIDAVVSRAKSEGLGTKELDAILGLSPGTAAEYLKAQGKAFADGGNYQGGLALVGEEGPELINFNQPGQIYTASQTSNILSGSNSDLITEIKALREEVVMLRAETRATVTNTNKTAKLLDRVIPDGQSVQVTVLA